MNIIPWPCDRSDIVPWDVNIIPPLHDASLLCITLVFSVVQVTRRRQPASLGSSSASAPIPTSAHAGLTWGRCTTPPTLTCRSWSVWFCRPLSPEVRDQLLSGPRGKEVIPTVRAEEMFLFLTNTLRCQLLHSFKSSSLLQLNSMQFLIQSWKDVASAAGYN